MSRGFTIIRGWGWKMLVAALLAAGMASQGCRDESSTTPPPAGGTAPAATATPGAAKPVVGVSLLTLTNPFFKQMGDTMRSEGEKRGYDVQVVSGELDPARQRDQVKDFLVRKAAALIITPCDSRSVGTTIAEANAAGVPVFTADIASIAQGPVVVCHTATDNRKGGEVAARAVAEAINGSGKVAIVGHPEVESGMMRQAGFESEIAKSPGIQLVAKLAASGSREKAFAVTQDLIQSNPDLAAIFAINDPTALGAIAALEKAGKAGTVKIVGFDGQLEARKAVKEGKLYATVMQFPDRIAASTIESIAAYMAGETVPKQKLIDPAIYRKAEADADAELK